MTIFTFIKGAAGAALAAALFVSGPLCAQTMLQGGPWTPQHVPIYSNPSGSQPVMTDGGGAAGGQANKNPFELGITSQAGNGVLTPPYANNGNGQFYAHFCMYDAPTTNATGYHYLCMDPNAEGGGLLAFGNGGAAPQLPLSIWSNGAAITFPFAVAYAPTGGVVVPVCPVYPTDGTTCIQSAINNAAALGLPLYFDGIHKYKITSQLTSSALVDLEGYVPVGNDGISAAQLCTSGLISDSGNINLLVLTGERAIVRNMCLQMTPTPGTDATAGTAILLGGTDQQQDVISSNTIFRPYGGLSFDGTPGAQVRDSLARDNVIRDCAGICISVGSASTAGATAGITLENNRIACTASGAGGVGFAFYDGAVKWDGTNEGPSNCYINTEIIPGANQIVNGQFYGVMGNSAGTHGGGASPMELYIEPQSSTGTINWLNFANIWASSVEAADTSIYIGNKNGGNCANIAFTGSAIHGYGAQTNIVNIQGCYNITLVGNQITNWLSGTATNGILIQSGSVAAQPSHVTITGNNIGTTQGAHLTNGINIKTGGTVNPDYLSIVGNEIGNATNPIVSDLANNQLGELWTMGNNEGVSNSCSNSVAASSSVVIPNADKCFQVTGTATVTSLNPVWQNRKVTLYAVSGVTLSQSGGSPGFCSGSHGGSALVLPAAGTAFLEFIGNCWAFQ